MKELKALNVKDYEVKGMKINFCNILLNFFKTIPFVLANFAFVISHYLLFHIVRSWSDHTDSSRHD
jgi:hypothetical protein